MIEIVEDTAPASGPLGWVQVTHNSTSGRWTRVEGGEVAILHPDGRERTPSYYDTCIAAWYGREGEYGGHRDPRYWGRLVKYDGSPRKVARRSYGCRVEVETWWVPAEAIVEVRP